MSIGRRISELRKGSSLSQEYVAEKLGVTRQAVSKWETDASAPDTYNLIALAELFDVSVEYIATGKKQESESVVAPTEEKHSSITANKTLGIVLLGVGLLSLILGAILSTALLIISVYLLMAGIIYFAVKKAPFLTIMWTYTIFTFLMISILTRANLFSVFDPSFYQDETSMAGIVIYTFWSWVTATLIFTGIKVLKRRKKQAKPHPSDRYE